MFKSPHSDQRQKSFEDVETSQARSLHRSKLFFLFPSQTLRWFAMGALSVKPRKYCFSALAGLFVWHKTLSGRYSSRLFLFCVHAIPYAHALFLHPFRVRWGQS